MAARREDIQHVPKDTAEQRRNEIVALMQEAWTDVNPYEHGFEEGAAEGRSAGIEEGRSQGYRWGFDKGFQDGKQSIVSYLIEKRENLMREQGYGYSLAPSRRRYLRNAIDVLSEIIQFFLSRGNESQ